MAELNTNALVKAVESLVVEKQAVTSKEKSLIEGLNAVLSKMGYRVVAGDAVPKRRGRPPGSTTKRRGGMTTTVNGPQRKRGPGRPPGSTNTKPVAKRRGRPPKVKTK